MAVLKYRNPETNEWETIIGGYKAPKGGIPKEDLSEEVQRSLNWANTALQPNNILTSGNTKCKVTYDENGMITAGEDLSASDIPELDASKITSGKLTDNLIANAAVWHAKQDAITEENKLNADLISGLSDVATSGEYSDLLNKPNVATLDEFGHVPAAQLPSYVDDVEEYNSKSVFPEVGESGKIYIDVATNITYRWGGSVYVPIGSDLALGETSSTAYAGDKGKANAEAIQALQTTKQDAITADNKLSYSLISGAPTSLPADGGNADTINGYKFVVASVAGNEPNTIYFIV